MKAIKKWIDKKEELGSLNLDLQNPRVPLSIKELKDEGAIRNYLIEKEGILKIAESIASNGYHKSVTAIVCDENGKLVVLDGNRRLAACQLLLNPSLAPTQYQKQFESLGKQCDKSEFARVKITIAPSRKDAEREIWDIHVNALLKPWQVLQKLRMYRNLVDDGELNLNEAAAQYSVSPAAFKTELAKLHFFEAISASNPLAEEVLLDSGFNKIDRLILGKHGKQYLNYTVSDNGKVVANDPAEHAKKLKALTPYVIQSSKIPAQATQEWIKNNVFVVLDAKTFSNKRGKKTEKKGKTKAITHPKCFVIMPLSGLDSVYASVQSAWRFVFGKKAKIFNQTDDKSKGGKELIDKKILRNISTSTAVVGVLSMGSKERLLHDAVPDAEKNSVFQKAYPLNANVALEIGYAARCADEGAGALKDYFLIADASTKHSAHEFVTARCFDLGHRDIIPYTESELEKLEKDLCEYFVEFKEQQNL